MCEYVEHIIVPYVESIRDLIGEDKPALAIMDNFKGLCTPTVKQLLQDHNIHICYLPPNTTDLLQPLVNKQYLKQEWYSIQLMKQLQEIDVEDEEDVDVDMEPVDISLAHLKELGGKWMVGMAELEYIAENPQIIVNGFVRSVITTALDQFDNAGTDDDAGADICIMHYYRW